MHNVLTSFLVFSLFNSAHGAGETIRGTINDTLDGVGKGIAGDGTSTKNADGLNSRSGQATSSEDHGSVIQSGKEEFRSGVSSIENAGNK